MGLFIALLTVPILLQRIVIKEGRMIDYKKKNQRALAFFFALLTVMVALRHETVGTDTSNYHHFFSSLARMPWSKVSEYDLEIGYSYFNKFVSIFTEDSQVFLAITVILSILMIYPTFKRLCVDPSLTVTLFCIMSTFFMLFSGVRQMLAIGLGFVAYECARKKKIVLFLLVVALALSIHTSAFMLLLIYPLYHAKITKKWLLIIVPFLACLFVFNDPIFSFLSVFIERYTKYDAEISSTGAYTMIVLFAIFALFAYIIPDEKKMDQETIGLRNFLIVALALQMFAPLHTLAMRMNYYFIIFIPLAMPKIIEARSKRWKNVGIWGKNIMTAFFFLYFFMSLDGGNTTLNVYPYHFFWENVV